MNVLTGVTYFPPPQVAWLIADTDEGASYESDDEYEAGLFVGCDHYIDRSVSIITALAANSSLSNLVSCKKGRANFCLQC